MKKNEANSATFKDTELSANMEDYIETISLLSNKKKVVRVKDIAKSLNITMPSVTAALNRLKEKKLINYEKYGFVELTQKGKKIAKTVYEKHTFLNKFFHDILRMEPFAADDEACRIEHHLSPSACLQLNRMVEYYQEAVDKDLPWTRELRSILDERTLSSLKEGNRAVLKRINPKSPIKKRLSEMGFRKGEIITIVRYAPLRDPMEISIKGFHLSLRVGEASDIIVTLPENNFDNE